MPTVKGSESNAMKTQCKSNDISRVLHTLRKVICLVTNLRMEEALGWMEGAFIVSSGSDTKGLTAKSAI